MAAQQPADHPSGSAPAPRPFSRSLVWPAAAVALGVLLVHNSVSSMSDDKPPAPPPAATASAPPRPTTSSSTATAQPGLPRSAPTWISIKDIGVEAPFTALSLDKTGRLAAPPPNDTNLVGWYEGGATPGERGTAIVAGHVDTTIGPAVFLQLRTLKPGDTVDITRADGTIVTFAVDSVETFSKANFPDDRVYADSPDAQLRLITCGGSYDRKARDYQANVVVFAHLDSVRRT